jgi:nitrogen regulatory protein P-II 1
MVRRQIKKLSEGGMSMIKIECILRPEKFEKVREALSEFGIKGMTISQVMGCGLQKGYSEYYRGAELSVNLLPKVKLEIVTTDDRADEIVSIIRSQAVTGNVGDGKVFITPIRDAIRLRTGESGDLALK